MAGNPYQAPRAPVSDVESDEEFQEVRMWSASGRVGRLRYLAYTTGAYLLCGLVFGFLSAFAPMLAVGVAAILYLVALVFGILVAIQRSHDMDWSGWTVLLMLIPLAAFIWVFAPGTKGVNNYGAPPPPNTTGVMILGLLLPIISFIGIIAAIAIPAYVEYTRAAGG